MSFQASNTFAEGVLNTQGVVRFRDFGTTGVAFAIIGGTGRYKKAHGAVTVKNGSSPTTSVDGEASLGI
jgi:hypothetical protein